MTTVRVTKDIAAENPMAAAFLDVASNEVTSAYPIEFKTIELYRLTNGLSKARLFGIVHGPVRAQILVVYINEHLKVVRARTLD